METRAVGLVTDKKAKDHKAEEAEPAIPFGGFGQAGENQDGNADKNQPDAEKIMGKILIEIQLVHFKGHPKARDIERNTHGCVKVFERFKKHIVVPVPG